MNRCIESTIEYNTSTLEKIINDPDGILNNEDLFWTEEKSQKLTKIWANNIGYTISFDKWRNDMQDWARTPIEKRRDSIFMKNAKKIIESKESFLKKALPYICNFLPDEAQINVIIHFTAFIPSRAFAQEDIVINVNATYWKENSDNIINTLIHELFHAGYSWCCEHHSEKKIKDEKLYEVLYGVVNEGICTYVAYKALPLFPAPDEQDFKLLENQFKLKDAFKILNSIISGIPTYSNEMLQNLIMDECILNRAYYITGSYASKVIDEKKGRKVLIQKLLEGPISFLNLYNSLTKDELKIKF